VCVCVRPDKVKGEYRLRSFFWQAQLRIKSAIVGLHDIL